ncbi:MULTISPECIES: excisionase family DNA-binding protein [unclassified Rhodococcus (in: high G+C Gram-positive bacteria)]|uniref:excisionase family DNA-binding protein n=1 Tax=unclassified Rhodococcus (in: high G+C Gram-positive bacteria) TaxID=192944 RepID=UPI0024B7AFFD|nr:MULTISPECIES: excisionase family DNA-binding protein [unclassified Rhodococcus (in: high G+C Gram-positive bacteria)]MDI9959235.1 excisionase family DNA-binding protein [Rhodococcus sp. IEGM 1237]MDI9964777.1 excisionase family DNA-binding protein [Rhodococcus sp. IEGM 1251]MDV8127118.1 excisionase family DNA-binding protein [Rhodococcus sp. IEGM 1304]
MARKLITIAQAADALGVEDSTIRRWIRDGRLPAFRLAGRQVRIDVTAVDALLTPIGTAK